MTITFDNILVPVDFSINTEIAVKKALALIEQEGAIVHLLHVLPSILPVFTVNRFFPNTNFHEKADRNIAARHLEQWRESILENFPGLNVCAHLIKGNTVESSIIQFAAKIQPQLMIIGKNHYHNWLTFLNTIRPNALVKTAGCPVLTVKPGSLNNKIKAIVFPVQKIVPNKKLDLLITLAKRYRARVYLVILENSTRETSAPLYNAFIETFRTLKSTLNTPIDHMIIPGTDLTKEALKFAASIGADMILINPVHQAKITLLAHQQKGDIAKGNSKLEVLSVQS